MNSTFPQLQELVATMLQKCGNKSELARRCGTTPKRLRQILAGSDVSIPLSEIAGILREGETLGLRVLHRPSLVEALATGPIKYVVGGYNNSQKMVTHLSNFDTHAIAGLQSEVARVGGRSGFGIEVFSPASQAPWDTNERICVIGSPRINEASEIAACLLTNSNRHTSPPSRSAMTNPFYMYWGQASNMLTSTFQVDDTCLSKATANKVRNSGEWAFVLPKLKDQHGREIEKHKEYIIGRARTSPSWSTYGTFLCGYAPRSDASSGSDQPLVVVACGQTAPATQVVCEAAVLLPDLIPPPSVDERTHHLTFFAVHAKIHKSGLGADPRKVHSHEVIRGPYTLRVGPQGINAVV